MLTLTVGDTAPALTGTTGVSLVGATAEVHIRRPDRTVIDRPAVITDGTAGDWSMDWQVGDLNNTGTYYVELEVTFAAGEVQTFALDPVTRENARFRARSQIA